ncbi:MAG: DUF456 family protein [Lentisphaerae bacterium]|nr:DUF456 family protein [Lentisphaerota bacterium]
MTAAGILTCILYVLILLLCLAGLLLSAVSLSGTWLVLAAALVARWLPGTAGPGWGTVAVFAALAVLVEVGEALAGGWGVRRRGGSRLAGVAAIVGGLAGLVLGGLIPIPIVGSLLGMCAVGFVAVYAVERHRLQATGAAAHIAWGAVLSRLFVMLLKAGVTLGMIAWLVVALMRG